MTMILLLIILNIADYCVGQCIDNGQIYAPDNKWVRNNHFLVTCKDGTIKTLKCVTDAGNLIDVGTKSHTENGYEYSCMDHNENKEVNVNTCGTFADFSDDIFKDKFAICCISRRFKGCVDINGDIVKSGFFVLEHQSLKYCRISANQMSARIEPKGCFNGTNLDDVSDESFHIKKYTVWRQGDYEYRCGDEGIKIQRCFIDENGKKKAVWRGTAWINKSSGVVEICGSY